MLSSLASAETDSPSPSFCMTHAFLEDQNSPKTRAWVAKQVERFKEHASSISDRKDLQAFLKQALTYKKCSMLSKHGDLYFDLYTTKWNELPKVMIK